MSFRTVMITKQCKLSYKNDYLIVRAEDTKMIHLSEISFIIVSTTAVSITAYLINELVKNKIGLLFCDEHHNPLCDIQVLHGSYDSSRKTRQQIEWKIEVREYYWQEIVRFKICKQKELLEHHTYTDSADLLESYIQTLSGPDISNREGHAAKVYFNCIFGEEFKRRNDDIINGALNYGYAVLLSLINKEIYCNGYLTELGIQHKNVFNQYNLASDLMEPFRPVIDKVVIDEYFEELNTEAKAKIINFQNLTVKYKNSNTSVGNVIKSYVKTTLENITSEKLNDIEQYHFYESQT